MIYIGIDPGLKGGIALIRDESATAVPFTKDLLKEVCRSLKEPAVCFLEKVGAMPGQGVTSMFNFGTTYGYIMGVLEAFDIPYQLISPQKWKKHFSLDKDKTKSVETAKRLFPTVSLLPTERCHKENDGMAEALLIALYGKRTDGGAK